MTEQNMTGSAGASLLSGSRWEFVDDSNDQYFTSPRFGSLIGSPRRQSVPHLTSPVEARRLSMPNLSSASFLRNSDADNIRSPFQAPAPVMGGGERAWPGSAQWSRGLPQGRSAALFPVRNSQLAFPPEPPSASAGGTLQRQFPHVVMSDLDTYDPVSRSAPGTPPQHPIWERGPLNEPQRARESHPPPFMMQS